MLLPNIISDNFLTDIFDDTFPFTTNQKIPTNNWMSTDVKDMGENYELNIELPGYDKKDINAELSNGYLTVSAHKQNEKEENDENGKFIRKERFSGSLKRSFYIGNNLKEEDFKASFENGILKLVFPKGDATAKTEEKKYIDIK